MNCFKRSERNEDIFILRLAEMRGDHSLASVTFGKDFAFKKAELSDGLERPLEFL